MSISAHGATLDVTAEEVIITRSLLARSLGFPAKEIIALATLTGIDVTEPTAASFGTLTLHRAEGPDVIVRFAPGCSPTSSPTAAHELIDAARQGKLPAATAAATDCHTSAAGGQVVGLNFVALDVETANDSWGSICQVGVVRFRNGRETASASWLCTPPPGYNYFLDINIDIHGIKPDDIQSAPAFSSILPEVVAFIGDDVMVAHNAQFDSTALREAAQASGADVPHLTVACSLALARDASRSKTITVANHKLPTVAKALGCPDFTHHDATKDARAAGLIVAGLARAYGFSGSIYELFSSRGFTLGHIAPEEVMPVLLTQTAPRDATDRGAGTDFRDTPAASPSPAQPSAEPEGGPARGKRRGGSAPWAAVATPQVIPEPAADADPHNPLYGANVTLTGDFEPFDKATLWQAIAAHGGQVGKSVTKKTTILVLGTWATKTSKEKRAEALIATGQDIQLWPQDKLLQVLGLDPKPPF